MLTKWSFPYFRELEEIVADYVNWTVANKRTVIHVYPDGGGRTNTAKVLKLLAHDIEAQALDIELEEVKGE